MFINTTKLQLHANYIAECINNIVGYIKIPYTLTIKSLKCCKDAHALVVQITSMSQIFLKIVRVFEPVKMLHIPLYSVKCIHSGYIVLTEKDTESRMFAIWKVYESLKKLTSGVSSMVSFFQEFIYLSPVFGSVLQTAGFFFLPVTMVGASVGTYKTFQRTRLYVESSNVLTCKMDSQNAVIQACQYLQRSEIRLYLLKVYTNKNELEKRVGDLYMRIQKSPNVPKDAQKLLCTIRQRMKHQLIHEALRAAIKITSSVTMILLAVAVVPSFSLAVLELTCSVGGVGAYLYAQHISLQAATSTCCPIASLYRP